MDKYLQNHRPTHDEIPAHQIKHHHDVHHSSEDHKHSHEQLELLYKRPYQGKGRPAETPEFIVRIEDCAAFEQWKQRKLAHTCRF